MPGIFRGRARSVTVTTKATTDKTVISGGGLFGLDFLTTADAEQFFLEPPNISEVLDEVRAIPFENQTGQTLNVGDCVCWDLDIDNRKQVAIPAANNLFEAAGIVVFAAVPDESMGWLAVGGKSVNALVLGEVGLVPGDPLTPVAGQVYLQKIASPVPGVVYPFTSQRAHASASQTLIRVRVRLPI